MPCCQPNESTIVGFVDLGAEEPVGSRIISVSHSGDGRYRRVWSEISKALPGRALRQVCSADSGLEEQMLQDKETVISLGPCGSAGPAVEYLPRLVDPSLFNGIKSVVR